MNVKVKNPTDKGAMLTFDKPFVMNLENGISANGWVLPWHKIERLIDIGLGKLHAYKPSNKPDDD